MRLQLKNVRIAFCQHLFRAGAMNAGDKPSFSATFLIRKDDPQLAEIRKVMDAVAAETWGPKNGPVNLKALSASGKVCLRDGVEKAQYDGFDGCYYISARSYVQPGIFDRNLEPLAEASGKPYAGCYVNASIDIWAQDNNYGKRVNAGLRGVQFYGDGDAFSGSAPADADEFDDLSNQGDDLAG